MKSVLCSTPSRDTLRVRLTVLVIGLDVLTDIMSKLVFDSRSLRMALISFVVVSIPILLLRRAKMRLQQKVALGSFTCLSLVMVIMAIIRASKMNSKGGEIVWMIFWQWMEAVVAVLMASITTFRAFLVGQGSLRLNDRQPQAPHSWVARIKLRRKAAASDGLEEGNQLPAIPSATLTGLRSFIRRNHRSAGETAMMRSDLSIPHEDFDKYRTMQVEGTSDQDVVHELPGWHTGRSVRQPRGRWVLRKQPSSPYPETLLTIKIIDKALIDAQRLDEY